MFTEHYGFDGPIYMSAPTFALSKVLLTDYLRIARATNTAAPGEFFTHDDIVRCMAKVRIMELHEVVQVDDELQLCAYYAGHVLGATMVHAKTPLASAVYTGDYNMTPDRYASCTEAVARTLITPKSLYLTHALFFFIFSRSLFSLSLSYLSGTWARRAWMRCSRTCSLPSRLTQRRCATRSARASEPS